MPSSIEQVRPGELARWFARQGADTAPVVLDVRESAELRSASVRPDGFTLLCIPMGSVPQRLAELDPDMPIACLCHHGARSMRVAQFLQQQGFARVANIAGGIHAWALEHDPAVAQY